MNTRYSNQLESKSRQNPCHVQPPENVGNLWASRRFIWVRTTVSTVWSAARISESELLAINTSYREDCLMCSPSNKVIKSDSKSFSGNRRVARRRVVRHFTRNGADQCQNGSSNLLTPYREQPRSTRIVAYPRPAFSATKRKKHAPIDCCLPTASVLSNKAGKSRSNLIQVSEGHTSSYRNKEN